MHGMRLRGPGIVFPPLVRSSRPCPAEAAPPRLLLRKSALRDCLVVALGYGGGNSRRR